MILLRVADISKRGESEFALKDISFNQARFQKIAIVGETGSGKSTLLKIIAGLIEPDNGMVLIGNERVEGPSKRLVPGNSSIAYLSQYFDLPKFLRVEQILAYANTLSQKEARMLYEICQIDHLLARKTDQLSGGERQRIAMARLLTTSPRLLLLDEPYSHLDMVHKNILKSVVRDITRKLKITCILVSHDPTDILPWADKILAMKDGQIIQEGTPEQVYRWPVNEYVAGLLGRYLKLNSELAKAISGLTKSGKIEKNIFYRPECFKIASKKKRGLKGKVASISFFGSYYEIDIQYSQTIITIRTTAGNLETGDDVYFSLSDESM